MKKPQINLFLFTLCLAYILHVPKSYFSPVPFEDIEKIEFDYSSCQHITELSPDTFYLAYTKPEISLDSDDKYICICVGRVLFKKDSDGFIHTDTIESVEVNWIGIKKNDQFAFSISDGVIETADRRKKRQIIEKAITYDLLLQIKDHYLKTMANSKFVYLSPPDDRTFSFTIPYKLN